MLLEFENLFTLNLEFSLLLGYFVAGQFESLMEIRLVQVSVA
jgi:hypothetical protein